jgi:uncharacterized repeat protein (TIGR03943 family)
MTEEVGSATVLLVGALLVRLYAGGAYARYVRVGMGPWLLVAGILLALLGLAGVLRALLRPEGTSTVDGGTDGHGTDGHGADGHGHHDHGERVGWLLLAPVVALLMVAPPALGSFGVDRSTAVSVSSGGRTFAALPAGATVPMTLLEFDERAADHDGASFGTTQVRLTGFVADTGDGTGFRLARYQIACCAADAVAAIAKVVGVTGDPPTRDSWVVATGTYRHSSGAVPELVVSSLTSIPPPVDPYE